LETRPWGLVGKRQGIITIGEGASDFHWMLLDMPSPKGIDIKLLALDDISAVKHTSRELDLFFEMSPDGMLIIKADGEVVRANRAFGSLFGVGDSCIYDSLWDLLDPQSKVFGREDLLSLWAEGGHRNFVLDVGSPNLPSRSLEASFIADSEEGIVYATLRDITSQKLDEARLMAQANQLLEHAELLDVVHDSIIVYNHFGRVENWNRGAERTYGWRRDEVLGVHQAALFRSPESKHKDFQQVLTEGGHWWGELTRTRSDGTDIVVLCNLATCGESDCPEKVVLEVSRDVTAWREIMLTESKLAALVRQSSNAIVSATLGGEILSWNDAAVAILGYSAAEALGGSFGGLLLDKNTGWSDLLRGLKSTGQPNVVSVPLKRRDGSLLRTLLTVSPLKHTEEVSSGVVLVIRDLSREEAHAKEFARIDRLNYVGQLARGMAQELRNPLTTARGFVQLFATRPELVAYASRFDLLLSEMDRMNDLLGEFITLSSTRHVELEPKVLNDTILALRESLTEEAQMEQKIVCFELADVPPVCLSEKEVRALIINLVRNALEASPPGGVVTVRTEQQENAVLLSVEDRGVGISAESKEHIGTPFFTTKKHGTGMGLTYCYSIARLHQASISFTSEGGVTTFRVLFPLARGA